MGIFVHFPAWAQWTIFGGIVLGGAFGIFFALFVTWPFIRLSNKVMTQGIKVNTELLAFFERAKVSVSPQEAREIVEGLKKLARSGGGDLASRI